MLLYFFDATISPHLLCSPEYWGQSLPRLRHWWHPCHISPWWHSSGCGRLQHQCAWPPWSSWLPQAGSWTPAWPTYFLHESLRWWHWKPEGRKRETSSNEWINFPRWRLYILLNINASSRDRYSILSKYEYAHRDREDDFRVTSQVSDVAVQWHALLCCTSLAHSQGDTKDGVSTKLSCGKENKVPLIKGTAPRSLLVTQFWYTCNVLFWDCWLCW